MAVITCPVCGKRYSSCLASCPFCGHEISKNSDLSVMSINSNTTDNKISSSTVKQDATDDNHLTGDDKIVVVRRDRNQGAPGAGLMSILGLILLFIPIYLVICIAFIIVGSKSMTTINKNNFNTKELVYFNKSTNQFSYVDINGCEHIFNSDPKNFKRHLTLVNNVAIKNNLVFRISKKENISIGFAIADDIKNIDDIVATL